MHNARSTIYSQALFALIPAFPSALFGLLLIWQQGFSMLSGCIAVLMVAFSAISGTVLWLWHSELLDRRTGQFQQKHKKEVQELMAYITELEKLLQLVTPKIGEQIAAARELTEREIAVLIGRFSGMLDELQKIIEFASQEDQKQLRQNSKHLKNNAEKIRGEIDEVLASLQFQDRVSQILTQVGDNVGNLKSTVDNIQRQGSERSRNMIRIEETLAYIQSRYESVNQLHKQHVSGGEVDDLTFF